MIAIFPAPNERVDDYTDRPHNSIYQTLILITPSVNCKYYDRVLLAPQPQPQQAWKCGKEYVG